MPEQIPSVEQILQKMREQLGEEPRPMAMMAEVLPQWLPQQAQGRKFVFDLPHIPAKYKHLIMVAVAAAVESPLCTETYIKLAHRAGVSKEEIGEALVTARFAAASTIFAASLGGLEYLAKQEK